MNVAVYELLRCVGGSMVLPTVQAVQKKNNTEYTVQFKTKGNQAPVESDKLVWGNQM